VSREGDPTHGDPVSDAPADESRRAFFRSLSRNAVNTAGQAVEVAAELQRTTGEAIGAALGLSAAGESAAQPVPDAGGQTETGPHTTARPDSPPLVVPTLPPPYHLEGETLWLLDQMEFPDSVREVACNTLSDLSMAMNARQVSGAPLLAEVTAFGLWLALLRARGASIPVKRTRLRTTGAALRAARSNVATIPWAVARMVEAWDAAVEDSQDEPALEAAMRAAAEDIAGRIRADVAAISQTGAAVLEAAPTASLEVMILGATGYLGAQEAGGAAGIAASLAASGRPVHAWIVETDPVDAGGRLTAWGLAQAGIPTIILSAAGAGWAMASRPIDAVIVAADRISVDGRVTAVIGTYGLASLASRHGVPTYVAAALATIDPAGDETDPGAEWEPSTPVDPRKPGSARLATQVGSRGALQDVTPPDLIDGIITEVGVLRAPFAASIASALTYAPRS
jgi:methylthioribose-1-phosphate isomerase